MSSRSRDRRRSRTPVKRHSLRERRLSPPLKRDDGGHIQKRTRVPSKTSCRTKSPQRLSGERRRYYPPRKEDPPSKPRSSSPVCTRDEVSKRFESEDKYVVNRPLFRGSDIIHDRDRLKKIVVNMSDIPAGNDNVKREIINAEEITVVRRAANVDGSSYHRNGIGSYRASPASKYDYRPRSWNERNYQHGRMIDIEEPSRYSSEGSRPIFDRDEIKNHSLRHDEDRERTGLISRGAVHAGRRRYRSRSPIESLRSRDYDEERGLRDREYSSGRQSRDARPRSPGSSWRGRRYERSREYPPERHGERDGHRSYRRSLERDRSEERLVRRHPSPGYSRSPERRDGHHREHEVVPVDGLSAIEYPLEGQGYAPYYETDVREGAIVARPRGRGRGIALWGRGIPPAAVYPRPAGIIMRPVPPVWPVPAGFIPRAPAVGRRFPFPPRIRPVVSPAVGVLEPVIRVRPPVIPIRPPSVRHR